MFKKEININFDNNIPIYIQLVEYLKSSIVSGELTSGERLPSVRDLSMRFAVNPNTMQKALAELENNQLIYTERTNGKFITKDEKILKAFKKTHADEITKNYLITMKELGFSKEEIKKLIGG